MKRSWKAVALLLVVGMLGVIVTEMHQFGRPGDAPMDEHILENAQYEAGTNNVVTAVVFDYRGIDTLGEATVLLAAVVGVLLVLRRERE